MTFVCVVGLLLIYVMTSSLAIPGGNPGNPHNPLGNNNTLVLLSERSGSNTNETGRVREKSDKMTKFLIPLLAGFKITALVTATFTALKIFIVQSLVVSKIALLGATLLAIKAVYDHLQQKFLNAKIAQLELYPYHGFGFPEWPAVPEEWTPDYPSYHGDLQGMPSGHTRVAVPHIHDNDTFAVRSDGIRGSLPPHPALVGYETIVTKITETTHD